MTWSVSGVGALASTGRSADALFDALCAGRTGLAELRAFDKSLFRAQHAYEIDDRPAGGDVAYRASALLAAVIEEALADAGLQPNLADVPVLVGTGLRELRSLELWWKGGAIPGGLSTDDLHFGPMLRQRFGATDTQTFSNACSASVYALAHGVDLLEQGEADTVVVAGVDVLTESMYGLLERVHQLPPDEVRPFDRNRKGVLMGDGAAAIVLRNTPDQGARSVLRSVAVNCDANHVTAPDVGGIATAVRSAHDMAGVKPVDIGLLMLHGTGTLLNDEVEAQAIHEVFGQFEDRPLMTAMKSMTGHTSGASGLMNLVIATLALERGILPPTLGLLDPVEDAAGFRFATGSAQPHDATLAQIDAFGFGGVNAVAIVERVA